MTSGDNDQAPETPLDNVVPGLVSVTFRQLAPDAIVRLVADNGLRAIEWGGDVHVPVGELRTAEEVRRQCSDHGLEVVSFGSYFRAGASDDGDFADVLRTAEAVGAPSIRVWAGDAGSAAVSPERRRRVETALASARDAAAARGLRVALEFHPNTLTDTLPSTLALLGALPGIATYWQPGRATPAAQAVAEVGALLPRLSTAHVFSWAYDGSREALGSRPDLWSAALRTLGSDGSRRYALLEFVAGDEPVAFERDAATLLGWLGQPDAGRPDARQPDARRPDARRPDARRPDARRPDARRPGGEPDGRGGPEPAGE